MNDRALTGVLMLGAAAGLAWAWLNGHLTALIDQTVAAASGKKPVPSGGSLLSRGAQTKINAVHGTGGARDPFRGEL